MAEIIGICFLLLLGGYLASYIVVSHVEKHEVVKVWRNTLETAVKRLELTASHYDDYELINELKDLLGESHD